MDNGETSFKEETRLAKMEKLAEIGQMMVELTKLGKQTEELIGKANLLRTELDKKIKELLSR